MKLALFTSKEMGKRPEVDEPLSLELERRGIEFDWVIWSEDFDLTKYDVAIFRTIWDYFDSPALFRDFLGKLKSSQIKTYNSVDTVLWNMDKRYLRELSNQGVEIVPSAFFDSLSEKDIEDGFSKFETEKIVLKPVFGAGAAGAFVLEKQTWKESLSKIQAYYIDSKREAFIQPFLPQIQEVGEYSLHFFNKEFSHAILKTPKPGDFRSQEEFGSQIVSIEPPLEHIAYAQRVVDSVEESLLYARVDFVVDPQRGPQLMELELIEPALYWQWGSETAETFVSRTLE